MSFLPRISFALLSVAMLSVFIFSSDVLILFGYNFAAGGSFLFKIHPSFYLLFLAYGSIFFYKNSTSYFYNLLFKKRNFLLLIASMFCFLYLILVLKQPMAPFIVTWLSPLLIFIIFESLSSAQRDKVYYLLLGIIVINALIGILEYIQGGVFIPKNYFSAETGGLQDISSWEFARAVALYGHPLTATLVSATVVVGFYAKSLAQSLTRLETICLCVSVLSLPAFGGRTSIAVCLVLVLAISFLKLNRFIKGAHISKLKMISVVVFILSLPLIIISLYQLGLFDSLLLRLQDDNGSAATRLTAIEIFFDTPFTEILFGDYNHQLLNRQLFYGTKYGIEIFWLALILQFGLFVSAVMIYILFVFHKYLYEKIGYYTIWPSLTFLLAISSGVGLAARTLTLSHFIIILLFLISSRNREHYKNN